MSNVLYLIQTYWPFLIVALLIGLATGWYATPDRKDAP